ncbi:MAG: flagellin [Alphaproteobacteria bacterium]|nr:flagellin [Alphaproteobacteria bacterium]
MITGIGGLTGSQSQQNIQKTNSRLQAAIAQLVSGSRINRAADDVAALSIATQLQSEVSSLKQASGNIAQASSLAQVADGGIAEIRRAVDEIRSIAQQAAAPTTSPESREALNRQVQGLAAEIDRIAGSTSFNGKKLLDGSLSGASSLSLTNLLGAGDAADSESFSLDSLTARSLLGEAGIDVSTAQSAGASLEVLDAAAQRVDRARAQTGSFLQTLNYAAANIDSAVANQEAARSILQDADFAGAATEGSLASLLRNAQIAVQAQGNRLQPNVLKLIG